MADPIKFGPGWLRNQISSVEESRSSAILSGNTCSSVVNNGGIAKYRYGREEVIAAFDKDLKPPEIYYKRLFVEKIQPPMALNPADDENVSVKGWGGRIVNYRSSRLPRGLSYGGFNRSTENENTQFSDTWKTSNFSIDNSLKFPSSDTLNILPNESNITDITSSILESTPLSNLMNSNNRFYNRTSIRPSRSSRSGSSEIEKPCLTNHIPATSNSWNSTIAPSRKEFNNRNIDNWRENWRGSRPNWTNRSSSWREVEPEEKMNEKLPEWAVDTPINSGGTFDSSGAFLGSQENKQDSTTEVVDMVEKLIMDENEIEQKENYLPVPKWFYRDPHMNVQGPFTGSEMSEWYNHGYFDENLCLRREIDERFATLGEFIKLCGNIRVFEYEFVVPALKAEPPLNLNLLMSSLIPEQQTIFVNQLMLQNGFSEYFLSLQNLNVCQAPVTTAQSTEFNETESLHNSESDMSQNVAQNNWSLEKNEENGKDEKDEKLHFNKFEEKSKKPLNQKVQNPTRKDCKKKGDKKENEKQHEKVPTSIPSIAPWSSALISTPPLSLVEIQKAERRERRHEELQKNVDPVMNEKDNLLTWTKILPPITGTKSFAEIQAEEAKELAAVAEQQKKQRNEEMSTNLTSPEITWATAWKVIPVKEPPPQPKKKEAVVKKKTIDEKRKNEKTTKKDDGQTEFLSWCYKSLINLNSKIDVSTFITFLQDLDSPYEIKDYIRAYFGDSKESNEFAKQFLEKRSKFKNIQRAKQAHNDDLCQPAPAINPGATDFTEIKGKPKKQKKNKMTKLDARILGFSVTAAQDRINVGDRDYGDAV